MRSRLVAVLAVLVAGVVVAGPAQAGSVTPKAPSTTAPDLIFTVNVTMTNTKYTLSVHSGPRGADARFVIHNVSNKVHNFAIGSEKFDTGVQTGFQTSVKPGQQKILILFLDIRGKIPYFPGLKADRKNRGMYGDFSIGPCTHMEQITGVGEC
jgi:uncharacterized cupredoxin-like copper-binding protein